MPTTIIVTLFEGDYHYGVASLTNSLFQQGFRGVIYAGYKGALPCWAAPAVQDGSLSWKGSRHLMVAKDLCICFLPIDTDYHLTNYKPDFMLQVWNLYAADSTAIFYFDPDIVVAAPWNYFEEWVLGGVALCEDVNSPLSENHPRRSAWRKFYRQHNIALTFKEPLYVNGGYVGVHIENISFLAAWKKIQEVMALAIGGLNRSIFRAEDPLPVEANGPFAPFGKTDQDALNATIEAWDGSVSIVGKDGMSFTSGVAAMPHAIGSPKPWHRKSLAEAIAGRPPRQVDHAYWSFAKGPVTVHSSAEVYRKTVLLKVSAFICRFYRRG